MIRTYIILMALVASTRLLALENLPFERVSSGRSERSFQVEEVDSPGLIMLGQSKIKGEAGFYAYDEERGVVWIFRGSEAPRQLTEIKGREVRGFGALENGEFFLLTTSRKETLIERFNSRGRRYEHLKIKLQVENSTIGKIEFDGRDGFVLMFDDTGYSVDRWGHVVEPLEGYPLINSKESVNFEFDDGHIDLFFSPSEKTRRVRLPLFYRPDHVEFFRTTPKGIYFLIETELNESTYESTFFIYKVRIDSRRQTAGMFVNLPYSHANQRYFWFDDDGNIYLTTLKRHEYATWWIGNF